MQVVQVYLQPFRRSSLLKYLPQPKIAKKNAKISCRLYFKVIKGHRCWHHSKTRSLVPQTVTDRNAPWLNATKRLPSTLACREDRNKTGQNAQQPWINRNKTPIKRGRTRQNVKGPWDAVEYIMLLVPLRRASKFCYGVSRLSRFVALTRFY